MKDMIATCSEDKYIKVWKNEYGVKKGGNEWKLAW